MSSYHYRLDLPEDPTKEPTLTQEADWDEDWRITTVRIPGWAVIRLVDWYVRHHPKEYRVVTDLEILKEILTKGHFDQTPSLRAQNI